MEIIIRAPQYEEEERRVKKLLEKKDFYTEYGYNVLFPDDDLKVLFKVEEYEKGVSFIEKERRVIERAGERLTKLPIELRLFLPKRITIVTTKYGVGGSFDVASGRIVIMMRQDGSFSKPVTHLVVHELLHIATDESYARRLKFTHGENERFIDLLCRDVFGDLLVDYRMQLMGEGGESENVKKLVENFKKERESGEI